jgi:hypothetical protein
LNTAAAQENGPRRHRERAAVAVLDGLGAGELESNIVKLSG